MNETKFRAWDKRFKRMVEVFKITYYHESIGMKVTVRFKDRWNKDVYAELSPDNIVLMQYTGRKDKNGEEIYEGDIDENKYIVEWHNRTSEYLLRHKNGSWTKIGLTTNIIGNIYENPELLRSKSL